MWATKVVSQLLMSALNDGSAQRRQLMLRSPVFSHGQLYVGLTRVAGSHDIWSVGFIFACELMSTGNARDGPMCRMQPL